MKYLMAILEALKIPTYIFGLFWLAGIAFSFGVSQSKMYNELLTGKSIIITSFDLKNDDEEPKG